MKMIKIGDLLKLCYEEKQPKRIGYDGDIYECEYASQLEEKAKDYPICFIYRNIDDNEDFLLRDSALSLNDEIMIIDDKKRKRSSDKVMCIETKKIFSSPTEAGIYYGHKNGDMVSRVCRGVQKETKGLHFKYIKEGE